MEANPPSLTDPVSAGLPSSLMIPRHIDSHPQINERFFIGPMPSAVVEHSITTHTKAVNGQKEDWWFNRSESARDDDDSDDFDDFPERHAFRYFLQRGGNEEDWGSQESLKRRVKREILRRWKHSGWAAGRQRKNGETRSKKWVGSTFKIGDDFLGMPMLSGSKRVHPIHESDPLQSDPSTSQHPTSVSKNITVHTHQLTPEVEGPSGTQPSSLESKNHLHNDGPNSIRSDTALIPAPVLSSSPPSTPRRTLTFSRLPSSSPHPARAQTEPHIGFAPVSTGKRRLSFSGNDISSSRTPAPSRSALHHSREFNEGVRFPGIPQSQIEPLPPMEVLERRPSAVPGNSAAAATDQDHGRTLDGVGLRYGDVVRQARMLVRRSYVRNGNVGLHIDATEAMKTRDMRSYEWKEFLVVWRKKQLELYEDYSLPGTEMFLRHKHLAYVIRLQKPDTRLSLYSFIDFTFCLTCKTRNVPKDMFRTASVLSPGMPSHQNPGTDIFVFKTKTRTSGIDWMWELWRQLDGEIPQTLEVHCPTLETRVKLHIPKYDDSGNEMYKVMTRDHVVAQCRKALKDSPSWSHLMEGPIRRGASVELCWRREAMLDWIRWDTDMEGAKRRWAVMYGLCLGRTREITRLEIRIGEHRPTTVTLKDGTHLRESPAVEGYLYRIRPNSQKRTQIYLTTHGGYLFSIRPSHAHPPRPPIPFGDDSLSTVNFNGNRTESLKSQELRRGDVDAHSLKRLPYRRTGTQQVLEADAFVDLRNIVAVRRAFRIIAPFQHSQSHESGPEPVLPAAVIDHDTEDEGGDEVLAQFPNRLTLRMRRSFELLMTTGHVVRFETYSCTVAQDWVERLSQLIKYWTHRHREDASLEMALIQAITGNSRPVITRPGENTKPKRPPDFDQSSEYLPSFWNLCVVDNCLPVVRSGRLFLRRSLRGQYRLMQLVLVAGHLIQFHISSQGTSHHLRSRTTSLLDAYVCSGHYATQSLPAEEFPVARDPLCRRFQDGLENDDQESDTVFLIWYRPHRTEDALGDISKASPRGLNAKHHVLVLKARSKLERDAWCWALNAEFERISRRAENGQMGG